MGVVCIFQTFWAEKDPVGIETLFLLNFCGMDAWKCAGITFFFFIHGLKMWHLTPEWMPIIPFPTNDKSQVLAGVTGFFCPVSKGYKLDLHWCVYSLISLHFRCLSFQFQMARTGQLLSPAVSLEAQVKQKQIIYFFFHF